MAGLSGAPSISPRFNLHRGDAGVRRRDGFKVVGTPPDRSDVSSGLPHRAISELRKTKEDAFKSVRRSFLCDKMVVTS